MRRILFLCCIATGFALLTNPVSAQRGGPQEWLKRMDKNGNGKLDRDEVDGRAEGWLKRAYPEADFKKGVSIDKMAKKMSEASERRDRERREERDRDDRRGRDRDDDDDKEKESDYDVGALVPGFGEAIESPPVINFGSTPENYVEVSAANREKAKWLMDRYDKNKDGFLDRKERERNSRWSDDPEKYDTNRDGRISMEELSMRYAHHSRRDREREEGRRDRYDRARRSRSNDDEDREVEVVYGRDRIDGDDPKYVSAKERLPTGLPEWFAEKDENGDGQLSMAEFLAKVTVEEVEKFAGMDKDNDGILIAAELGADEGSDEDRSSDRSDKDREKSRSSDRSDRSRDSSRVASNSKRGDSSRSGSSRSSRSNSSSTSKSSGSSSGEVDAKYLKYAEGRVKKYDANRDGVLSVEECKAGKPGLVEADADKNGKITTKEVAAYYQRLYKR